MVVHMALELSLETKVRPTAPSGVVWYKRASGNIYVNKSSIVLVSGTCVHYLFACL